MALTYKEKLLDPRWQKKRLEIFERDEFSCVYCYNPDKTLHVHHLKYHGEPWETPNEFLVTVCEDCHKSYHDNIKGAMDALGRSLKGKAYNEDNVNDLADIIATSCIDVLFPPNMDVIRDFFTDPEAYKLIYDHYFEKISKGRPVFDSENLPF